jgi:hypothetical protein
MLGDYYIFLANAFRRTGENDRAYRLIAYQQKTSEVAPTNKKLFLAWANLRTELALSGLALGKTATADYILAEFIRIGSLTNNLDIAPTAFAAAALISRQMADKLGSKP